MTKILVTGAAGQLGAELCRMIGPDAVGVDIDSFDLTDGPAVSEAMARINPSLVIHCAAYTRVDQAETEPERCRAVNVAAVEHLARGCARLDCPLVQISTDYVFGGPAGDGRPRREQDEPAPQGVYAKTKWEGERAAARHPKHWIVRTCGLYARPSHRQAQNFTKTILRLAHERDRLRVVADQHCTPSYVPHVARAILFLAGVGPEKGDSPHLPERPEGCFAQMGTVPFCRAAPWGVYHVTNRGATTWHELACEIVRLAGLGEKVVVEPITTAEFAAPAPRPTFSVLDTAAYHRLGGPAMPDWKGAIAEYFEELRKEGATP